jgi:hypothetical protein
MDALFNAERDGAQWRAIKFFEGSPVDADRFRKPLLAVVAFNAAKGKGNTKAGTARENAANAVRRVPKQTRRGTSQTSSETHIASTLLLCRFSAARSATPTGT